MIIVLSHKHCDGDGNKYDVVQETPVSIHEIHGSTQGALQMLGYYIENSVREVEHLEHHITLKVIPDTKGYN